LETRLRIRKQEILANAKVSARHGDSNACMKAPSEKIYGKSTQRTYNVEQHKL